MPGRGDHGQVDAGVENVQQTVSAGVQLASTRTSSAE
jgi:hypothetical protein